MTGHPMNCQCTACWSDPRFFSSHHRPTPPAPDPAEVRRALADWREMGFVRPVICAAAEAWLREHG